MDYEAALLQEILKSLERLEAADGETRKLLASQNATLEKQADQLAEHIKRTNLLEEEMQPVREHVRRVNTILLVLGAIFACIGAVKGFLEILHFLHIL